MFCGGHFEFLTSARSASSRSGTEIRKSLGLGASSELEEKDKG